jgi:hypothetical protein
MSKKNRMVGKHKERKNFPWLFAVLGSGLLILTAMLLAQNSEQDGKTASIGVEPARIDYGFVKFGENRQAAIQVTNTGDGTLRFEEPPYIEVLEGC